MVGKGCRGACGVSSDAAADAGEDAAGSAVSADADADAGGAAGSALVEAKAAPVRAAMKMAAPVARKAQCMGRFAASLLCVAEKAVLQGRELDRIGGLAERQRE
ncbi:MAG: hypothetical protein CFE41_03210 [Burkholderiales bacterium PBB2]|nr:MAG: hypothetical protein CFE41_03210 [Burkholderiales bacterium PBB2]